MPARVQWTSNRINELHDFLKPWRHRDGTLKRGYNTAAAAKFGVSTVTIWDILKKYPKPIERESEKRNLTPQYSEDFDNLDVVQQFVKRKQNTSPGKRNSYMRVGRTAWKELGKKHPINWTGDDFKALWENPAFKDEETGLISFANASGLRNWMQHLNLHDSLNSGFFDTRGLKRAAGKKLTHWIKTEDEFKTVIDAIEFPDTLLLWLTGIQSGGRFSSHHHLAPERYDFTEDMILMWEPKVKEWVSRYFTHSLMQLLRVYIVDQGTTPKAPVFPIHLNMFNTDLKQAGKKAGLDFDLTSHVAMKHTFVSFASNHGVPLQIVAKQCGTDASTLMKFYAGVDTEQTRHYLQGRKAKESDFYIVMDRLNAYAAQRYQDIKGKTRRTEGVKKLAATRKANPQINWPATKARAESAKTPKPIREAWAKALKLHNEGLSDAEVKRQMGWKS